MFNKQTQGKLTPQKLSIGDFYVWKHCSSKQKLKRRDDNVPYLTDVVELTAIRKNTNLLYSTKYGEPCAKVLNFLQVKYIKNFSVFKENDKICGLNRAKGNAIVRKLYPFMPSKRRGFWLSIYVSEKTNLLNSHE